MDIRKFQMPLINFLRRHLITYRLLERVLYRNPKGKVDELAHRRMVKKHLGVIIDPLLDTYAPDVKQIPEVKRGWTITEKLIAQCARVCKEKHVRYILMVVPFEACIGSRWSSSSLGYQELRLKQNYPEEKLGALAQGLNIPVIMLKDLFEQCEDKIFPWRDGHFNPQTHALVAEAIYEKMRELGL